MALIDDVKNYLDITYEDADTEQKLTGIIERGQSRLQSIAGGTLNFNEEAQPRALLLDYCRYARSNALEMFERNFAPELVGLRLATLTQIEEVADGEN